jgi:spermidine synthase
MIIALSRDDRGAESASYMLSGEPYRFEYYNYYDLAAALRGPIDSSLLIGGGTFSYPRLFVAANPASTMDAVEIDPALYDLAKEQFGYVDDERISIFLEDGRTFLNRASGPYDAVFMDAFKSEQTVPYQLTTQESWQHVYDVLSEDGVLVMNVIAAPDDERAQFFNALYATIESVFPEVAAFSVQDESPTGVKNTMIVAMKNPDADIAAAVASAAPEFSARLITDYAPPAGTKVLTDDYAPVDQYLLGF